MAQTAYSVSPPKRGAFLAPSGGASAALKGQQLVSGVWRCAWPQSPLKRACDLVLSGGALAVLSPLFLTVALLVRLDSAGPAFFRQERVGRNGRRFTMLKFRSMHTRADAQRAALLALSDRDGPCVKIRKDPRITRVGRFLRRTSLDELPQLVNVLIGDMSLVGPRPALPEEVAVYDARALDRLAVRPGLTGLWQVAGRADIGFDKMIDMDLAYVQARTLWLDVVVLGLTLRAVVSGRGAY